MPVGLLEELELVDGGAELAVADEGALDEEDEAPVEGNTDKDVEIGVVEGLKLDGVIETSLFETEEIVVDDTIADSGALEDEAPEASEEVMVEVVVVVENVFNESEDGAEDDDGSDEETVASEDDTDDGDGSTGSASVGVAVLESRPLIAGARRASDKHQLGNDDGGNTRIRTRGRRRRRTTRVLPLPTPPWAQPSTSSLAISSEIILSFSIGLCGRDAPGAPFIVPGARDGPSGREKWDYFSFLMPARG